MGSRMGAAQRNPLIARAKAMAAQDISQREIAKELNVSQPTVSTWLRRRTPQERVADRIRAELVCCDIFQLLETRAQASDNLSWKQLRWSPDTHGICFYGEWAARIAEQTK